MSFDLFVYACREEEPARDQITKAVQAAGWRWLAIADGSPLTHATSLHGARALGWDPAHDIGAEVEAAVAADAPDRLAGLAEHLSVVTIEVERPFRPHRDLIPELREEGHDPQLVTRIEDAAACYRFAVEELTSEEEIEFAWALASAVGVLTDAVLEDVEEGMLLDCTDDGDE